MKFFYDCEFIDDGRTIDLVSIGIVREDGEHYYAVSSEFDREKLWANKWLLDNVWPHLPRKGLNYGVMCASEHPYSVLDMDHPDVKDRAQIRQDVETFVCAGSEPVELWAWYADYDHVVLSQLFGKMIDLPRRMPMFTNDIKQEHVRLGSPDLPDQVDGEHNALADARHDKVMFDFLAELESSRNTP